MNAGCPRLGSDFTWSYRVGLTWVKEGRVEEGCNMISDVNNSV